MRQADFEKIANLNGLVFVKALLAIEQQRFDTEYRKGSAFEEINADFGIFPSEPYYPVYFAGDITRPEGKVIFIGINPGFSPERNESERQFLRERGLFGGYCTIFDYFAAQHLSLKYYSNIAGFLRRFNPSPGTVMDWKWFQANFINLELIPYHSSNVNGLRINDQTKYWKVYFAVLLKLVAHLAPLGPVFINGFPTFRSLIDSSHPELTMEEHDGFWTGTIGGSFPFIGLPFLNRPTGGKDALVAAINKHLKLGPQLA